MDFRIGTSWLTAIIMVGAAFWFCPLLYMRKASTAAAGWVIGSVSMSISLAAYHVIPGSTVSANPLLYAAAFEIWVATTFVLWTMWRDGKLRVEFNWVQKSCLGTMVVILAYWALNKDQSGTTYWATQTLLFVAYVSFLAKVWQIGSAIDSIGNWTLIFVGSAIGFIPSYLSGNPYGIGNSVRAIVSSGILLSLLVYFDRRNGWERWSGESQAVVKFYKGLPAKGWQFVKGLAW